MNFWRNRDLTVVKAIQRTSSLQTDVVSLESFLVECKRIIFQHRSNIWWNVSMNDMRWAACLHWSSTIEVSLWFEVRLAFMIELFSYDTQVLLPKLVKHYDKYIILNHKTLVKNCWLTYWPIWTKTLYFTLQ